MSNNAEATRLVLEVLYSDGPNGLHIEHLQDIAKKELMQSRYLSERDVREAWISATVQKLLDLGLIKTEGLGPKSGAV